MILKPLPVATPRKRILKASLLTLTPQAHRLGNTVIDKNKRLAAVLKGVAGLNFGNFQGSEIDLFGDAYEFLISKLRGQCR